MKKPLMFIWRDLLEEMSYKLAFAMQIFGVLSSTLALFFLARLFAGGEIKYLKPYGGNYFSFALIGIAFFSYLEVSVKSLSSSIREGQRLGTLEALLVTQTDIPTILLSSSLYGFLWASFKTASYLLLGVLVFGINMGNANVGGALLILLLTIISCMSFGILSASFIMVMKRGDPVSWLFMSASGLLGGLFYPVSVLPGWLRKMSDLLPITYALEGMRLSLLKGYSVRSLMPNIAALVLFSIIMLPLSFVIFGRAVKRAKIDGSLTQY